MEIISTRDEIYFAKGEFEKFLLYLKQKRFVISKEYPSEFMDADSILDCDNMVDENYEKDYCCGVIINYNLGGVGNSGLFVTRGTRLESIVKEYMKLPINKN